MGGQRLPPLPKQLRPYIRAAEDQGWRLVHGNNHLKLYAPDGETIVVCAITGGKGRGTRNAIALLKKAGVKV